MTLRQIYEYVLIETNKVEAATLLLEDFNYLVNKAIIGVANMKYNFNGINQQITDDLSALEGSAVLTSLTPVTGNPLQKATYVVDLPDDYFHLLNCIVEYDTTKRVNCDIPGEPIYFGAARLTSGLYASIINNYYLKPSYKRPYYFIHNSVDSVLPANPSTNVPDTVKDTRSKGGAPLKLEIRYGKDNTLYVLNKVHIDYLRVPRHVVLTQDDLESLEDTTSVLEFPNYMCLEIIKELVKLLLENTSDPRLQTNIPVNQTIANPMQMQPSK